MGDRSAVPALVERLLERSVRWAPPGSMLSVYDGNERALQVFDTPLADQLPLLERLEPLRPVLEAMAGGPIVIIFYSLAQSVRLRSRESS